MVYLQESNPILQPICRCKEVVMDSMHVTTKIRFIRKIINWSYQRLSNIMLMYNLLVNGITYLLMVYLQESNPILQPICRYKQVVMDSMHVTTKIKFIRKIINWTYWIRTWMIPRNPMGLINRHWFDRVQTWTKLYRTKNNVILRKWWSWKQGQTSNQTLVVPQGIEPNKSTNLLAPHQSCVWVSTQHIMDGP